MYFRHVTLQQLRYIVAIADTSSFAQAAAASGVTQPTLSAMVRKLELELGITLFDRSTKPVNVTEFGDLVIARARQVLAQAESGQVELQYHIAADRFLRGMVRLIVGMCLNVGLDKLEIEDVKEAMDKQVRLKKDLSVEAKGLFLTEVKFK